MSSKAQTCVPCCSAGVPAHRPFFVVRNPATGELRRVGYASVENGMQQVLLTDGSTESALDYPEALCSAAKKRAASVGRRR